VLQGSGVGVYKKTTTGVFNEYGVVRFTGSSTVKLDATIVDLDSSNNEFTASGSNLEFLRITFYLRDPSV
jgi:hypothetical protein